MGSVSETVLPRSIVPGLVSAPPAWSMASNRVVLPAPAWPARARLRMRSVDGDTMRPSFRGRPGDPDAHGGGGSGAPTPFPRFLRTRAGRKGNLHARARSLGQGLRCTQ